MTASLSTPTPMSTGSIDSCVTQLAVMRVALVAGARADEHERVRDLPGHAVEELGIDGPCRRGYGGRGVRCCAWRNRSSSARSCDRQLAANIAGHERLTFELGGRRHAAVAVVVVDSDADAHGDDPHPFTAERMAAVPGADAPRS